MNNTVDEASPDLASLIRLAARTKEDASGAKWIAVESKLQELLKMPSNDEYFSDFDLVIPPTILESLIRVLRLSDSIKKIAFLNRICDEFDKFTFEHVRIAFEGSTREEVLKLNVFGEGETYERNESVLMLLLRDESIPRLKSAHFLVIQCPELLHIESFGDYVGDDDDTHLGGTIHPMNQFLSVQETVLWCISQREGVKCVHDYWFLSYARINY